VLSSEVALSDKAGNHCLVRELTPELRAFHELAQAAQGTYHVRDLLGRICASLAESFGFDRVAISRYVPEEDTAVPLVAHGVPGETLAAESQSLAEDALLGRALEEGRAVFAGDSRQGSVLAVPLVTGGRCLGFIRVDRGGRPFELGERDLDVLTTLATLVGVFLEKALAHEELARVDELKGQFVALASHELRTPAAVIHGISQTLHMRGDNLTGHQVSELRKTLYEQTDRMRRLVDQLLDLSRLEAKGIHLEPQPLWVRTRVEELVLMIAGEQVRDVVLEVSPQLEAIVDPNAFDRIVSNLIVNAFRHGAPPVSVSAEQRDRHFRLRVEDRGEGVPREFVPHLFERFTRSEASRKETGGAGLGLAIAKSYANAQGGDLLYHDAKPHGACFELVLPRP
jgi:signal transduction histidine kinase